MYLKKNKHDENTDTSKGFKMKQPTLILLIPESNANWHNHWLTQPLYFRRWNIVFVVSFSFFFFCAEENNNKNYHNEYDIHVVLFWRNFFIFTHFQVDFGACFLIGDLNLHNLGECDDVYLQITAIKLVRFHLRCFIRQE